jgi:hypothetical protein
LQVILGVRQIGVYVILAYILAGFLLFSLVASPEAADSPDEAAAQIDSLRTAWLNDGTQYESVAAALLESDHGRLRGPALRYLNVILGLGLDPGPYLRCGPTLFGIESPDGRNALLAGPSLGSSNAGKWVIVDADSGVVWEGPSLGAPFFLSNAGEIAFLQLEGNPHRVQVAFRGVDKSVTKSPSFKVSGDRFYPHRACYIEAKDLVIFVYSEYLGLATHVVAVSRQGEVLWDHQLSRTPTFVKIIPERTHISVEGTLMNKAVTQYVAKLSYSGEVIEVSQKDLSN